jgi:hypothetical protein
MITNNQISSNAVPLRVEVPLRTLPLEELTHDVIKEQVEFWAQIIGQGGADGNLKNRIANSAVRLAGVDKPIEIQPESWQRFFAMLTEVFNDNEEMLGQGAAKIAQGIASVLAAETVKPIYKMESAPDVSVDDLSDFGSSEPPEAANPITTPKTLLECALDCVRRGWFVFPCYPRSKAPAGEVVPRGFYDSSNDEAQVRAWWARNPNYNIAIDLGRSNLVVYDFDSIPSFDYLTPTFTVRTGRVVPDGVGGLQMYYTGSCKTHGHKGGGGEVRSRGAYVMAAGSIHPKSGNPYVTTADLPLAPSPEQNEAAPVVIGEAIGTDEQNTISEYVEAAFEESGIDYRRRDEHQGGFKWHIVCPWSVDHTEHNDPETDTSSSVIMWPSGKLIYECKHAHCLGIHQWIGETGLRAWMEKKVGHFLVFGDPDPKYAVGPKPVTIEQIFEEEEIPAIVASTDGTVPPQPPADEDEVEYTEENIPPFNPSVMKGWTARAVNHITRGTTLTPQFSYQLAKMALSARMAGNIKYEDLDTELNMLLLLIGITGSGKGAALARLIKMLKCESELNPAKIKIINSIDSGAGLRDYFLEPPYLPIFFACEELRTLGDKSAENRQPAIMNGMFEFADNYTASRSLASTKRKGGATGTESRDGCYFVCALCAQDKDVIAGALAGRGVVGANDRLYPEHAYPVEPGDMPPLNIMESMNLVSELDSMIEANRGGMMKFSDAAKKRLKEAWDAQSPETKAKVRWKIHLQGDAYIQAFSQGRMTVELEDVEDVLKNFSRQLIQRKVFLAPPPSSKIGQFIAACKRITEKMERDIARGVGGGMVAKSDRDFENLTNAGRYHEEFEFAKAFRIHKDVHLESAMIEKHGKLYEKLLPRRDHPCYQSPACRQAWKDGWWKDVTFGTGRKGRYDKN